MAEPGLRERKKAATRTALSRAAFDLAMQHGLDAVTVDAIAARADVSARTFRNYFSSGEDAILGLLNEFEQLVLDAFLMRDPDEDALDSIEAVILELVASAGVLDQTVGVARLMREYPSLVAHSAVHRTNSARLLAEIGHRTRMDPQQDLYPRLLYKASSAVTATVFELLSDSADHTHVPADLIRQGFAQLRAGLHQPFSSSAKQI
ncbi:MAG: TetR/AcrR family transcriptional regulator [Mycobacterium sp.]